MSSSENKDKGQDKAEKVKNTFTECEHWGVGGSYVFDPATGLRTRVPDEAEIEAEAAKVAAAKAADEANAKSEQLAAAKDEPAAAAAVDQVTTNKQHSTKGK